MKWILLLLLIPLVGATEYECNKAFYFLIDGGENITVFNELNNLNSSEDLLTSFTEICQRALPFKRQINISYPDNITECDLDLNKKIFWDSYDMDTSIGGISFYTNNKTCGDMKKWRWIIDIDEVDNSFKVTGVKLWFGLSLFILIPIAIIVNKNLRLNRKIEAENV